MSAETTETTQTQQSAPTPPKRKGPTGPSRRSFLRSAWGLGWLGVLGGFGGASLAFLWPTLREGFGAVLDVGPEESILSFIREQQRPFSFPEGRMYVVEYNPEEDQLGSYGEITGGARLMALYWRCVHLGCKVPWCMSSQWLECPCHGSRYNRWGEWMGGPAPRGLDRFPGQLDDNGHFVVDTAEILTGPSRQAQSLDQPAEGPTCT